MSCSTMRTGMLLAIVCTRCETRSRSAAASPASGPPISNTCGCEPHGAAVGRKHAGDQVEGGGFAGAVGADQRMDLAAVQGESGIADRADAAEVLIDPFHFEHRTLLRGGTQEGGQRQTFVDLALA